MPPSPPSLHFEPYTASAAASAAVITTLPIQNMVHGGILPGSIHYLDSILPSSIITLSPDTSASLGLPAVQTFASSPESLASYLAQPIGPEPATVSDPNSAQWDLSGAVPILVSPAVLPGDPAYRSGFT